MTKFTGSGLAIGVVAATAIAAVVLLVSVMNEKPSEEAVTETVSVAKTQPLPSSPPTEPAVEPEVAVVVAPKVVEEQPAVVEPVAEVVETQPEAVIEQPAPVVEAVKEQPAPVVAPVKVLPEVVEETTKVITKIAKPTPPGFDLVRIDESGSTVVAGRAQANASVSITLDGKVIADVTADATGAFVALLDIVPSDTPRELGLVHKQADGNITVSADKVLVMPFAPEAVAAPKLVVAKPDTVEVIAPTEIAQTPVENTTLDTSVDAPAATINNGLTLDTIVYDNLGDVVISGRGSSDDFVRIYLDNKPADVQKVTNNGQWKITLSDVPEGLYDLRVDSVDSAGAVTERVQSPFKREPTKLVANSDAQPSNVTIQPGYTLWALAEKRYGSGARYVQIYDANRDRIKDPDLIYPGQVFDLPN